MSFVPDTQNKEFQDALNLIQYTRQSVFLTGKAGTGKSTFLKYICANTKKKHVVLAPTGIAAINAGGSTLHSFFKLPFYPLLPDDPNFSLQRGRIHEFFKYTKPHRKLLEELELVIIDEISMVRADIIDAVDRILRVYSRNLREPFGGKQILLVGDVFQLEPVVKGDEREILNRFYPTPYFFSARVFGQIDLVSLELQKVYRQTDSKFIHVLDHIRNNTDLVDIIAERNPGRFISSTYGNARIDFMYASPSMYGRVANALIVIDKWTTATKSPYVSNFYDPSDHRPILVDFELK